MKRWEGCYDDSWKGIITDAAYAHPAKFSKSLVERIIGYMEQKGWLEKGMTIADPFGGVGTGAIIAAYRGYQWVGVELEPKFVELANLNFVLHKSRWERLGVPLPVIYKGDSRQFDEVIRAEIGADVGITSPPYVSGGHHTDVFDAAITSPVYAANDKSDYNKHLRADKGDQGKGSFRASECYGDDPAQIGRLRDKEGVDAAISSPPFLGARSGTTDSAGGIARDGYEGDTRKEPAMSDRQFSPGTSDARSEGNIEAAAPGKVDAVISSPPWTGNTEGGLRGSKFSSPEKTLQAKRGHGCTDEARLKQVARDEEKVMPHSKGQIADAPVGKVDAVISSPPYADIAAGAGGLNTKPAKRAGQQSGRNAKAASQDTDQKYGDTEGQLSQLPKGSVDAALTSPPYEDSVDSKGHGFDFSKSKPDYPGRVNHAERVATHTRKHEDQRYGDEAGQIGALKKQTYWQAMKEVYGALFRALKPGGVAAIVVKDFVKDKKRQRLCDDTTKLLVHVGFEKIERVRAMLVREYLEDDLFEGAVTKKKDRKSFFRRQLEKKFRPDDPRRIDWEEVLFVRKPPL